MKSNPTINRTASGLLGLIILPFFWLNGEESESPLPLEPYVVVTTKTNLELDRVSPSVEYVGAEVMEFFQETSLVDVLIDQTGMTLVRAGSLGSQTSLFTRGSESNHTAIFLDGRRLNAGFGNQYDLESLNIANVMSVQIQNGASSVLYGSSNIGGVIDLRTREGEVGPNGGTLSLEVGENNYGKASLDYAISKDDFHLSFATNYLETDNERVNDGYQAKSFSPRFDYNISEKLSIELIGQYIEAEKELPGPTEYFSAPDLERVQANRNYLISPGLLYNNEQLRIHAFYARSGSRLIDTNFGEKDEIEVISDELNIQIDYLHDELTTISVGGLYRSDEASDSNIAFFGPPVPYLATFDQTGFYLQGIRQFELPFELRTGVRYDDYNTFGSETTANIEGLYLIERFNLTLFAKLASAFAPPSAVDIAFDGDAINTPLAPESSQSYELGLRYINKDKKWIGSILAFRNEIDDLLDFVYDPVTFVFDTINVKEALTEGVELEVKYQGNEKIQLSLGYTYLTAVDESQNTRLLRRPRHTVNISLRSQISKAVSLGLQGTGYFDREDLGLLDFAAFDHEDQFVFRAVAEWKINSNIEAFARIENLFDEAYATTVGFPGLGRTLYLGGRLKF